MKVSKNLKDQ